VVSAHSYALMTTPDTLNDGSKMTYGFGLVANRIEGHRVITHGGGINGFTTAQMYLPDDSLSVIAFTNTDAAGPDFTAMNIARAAPRGVARAGVRGPGRAGVWARRRSRPRSGCDRSGRVEVP